MNAFIYIISYPFLFLISKLPFRSLYLLSDAVRILVFNFLGYRKQVIINNLKLALPHLTDKERNTIKKSFQRHFCDLFLEIIKSMGMSKKEMLKRFQIKNIEVLTQFEKQNRSAFIICGHYASWEWMMSLGYHMKHVGYGLYKPIGNPYFDKLIKKIRSKHNAYMIPIQTAISIITAKEQNNERGVYGFASDQSPRPKPLSYWRSFMGIEVPVYTGAERLARSLNIPVLFGKINRVKRGFYEVEFKVISDQSASTKEYFITDTFTTWLEEQITADPSQYLWTHKRFKYARKQ
ncbi:MAG: lysophospholipid acyltransferase family protein [Flavobacteriaceae bacterium]